ncbi:MAG: hypothetical protein FGM37_03185 [Phycisphaerales bacterium]|nr:hypothetical protein [Phycisphaerales bacterium]
MFTFAFHVRSAIVAASLVAFGGEVASAQDRIGIDFRSASSNNVAVGQVIDVEVYIVREPAGGSSFDGQSGRMIVMDLYFAWNPLDLRLIGINAGANAGQLMGSYFPTPAQDFSGTNEATPPADGTALYMAQALAVNPVNATLAGTRVTSFRFEVLRAFETTEVNPMVSVTMPNSTTQRFTRVVEATVNGGSIVTGTLSGVVIGEDNSCPADLDGDGLVEGPDLSFLLAAWETVNSPANFIRTAESPGVDGADLAVLLAAWGVCPN